MALPLSYNVRNLRVRWKVTVLAIGGIALVVAVFIALAAMAAGFSLALSATGSAENGIVVQRGSLSEMTSGFSIAAANTIVVDPRVQRTSGGQAMASPEMYVVIVLPKRADGEPTNVTVRGVTPIAFQVRKEIEIVEGRRFTEGLQELVIGRQIRDRIRGLDLGATIRFQKRDWKIVGVFTAANGGFESEIWGDLGVMQAAFNRQGGFSSLTVRLANPASLSAFDADIRRNPQVQLQMKDERQYYADQTGIWGTAMWVLAVFVAVVTGIGAVFGAMNTMYAIVAARTREIGTLRALGFRRRSILISFVMESMTLALVGGIIGCAIGSLANLMSAGSANATFSEIVWAFRVTPGILIGGLVFALVMGLIGGLLPAARAARMPITNALREA
jgi:putative ABC transport system permease protein